MFSLKKRVKSMGSTIQELSMGALDLQSLMTAPHLLIGGHLHLLGQRKDPFPDQGVTLGKIIGQGVSLCHLSLRDVQLLLRDGINLLEDNPFLLKDAIDLLLGVPFLPVAGTRHGSLGLLQGADHLVSDGDQLHVQGIDLPLHIGRGLHVLDKDLHHLCDVDLLLFHAGDLHLQYVANLHPHCVVDLQLQSVEDLHHHYVAGLRLNLGGGHLLHFVAGLLCGAGPHLHGGNRLFAGLQSSEGGRLYAHLSVIPQILKNLHNKERGAAVHIGVGVHYIEHGGA